MAEYFLLEITYPSVLIEEKNYAEALKVLYTEATMRTNKNGIITKRSNLIFASGVNTEITHSQMAQSIHPKEEIKGAIDPLPLMPLNARQPANCRNDIRKIAEGCETKNKIKLIIFHSTRNANLKKHRHLQ